MYLERQRCGHASTLQYQATVVTPLSCHHGWCSEQEDDQAYEEVVSPSLDWLSSEAMSRLHTVPVENYPLIDVTGYTSQAVCQSHGRMDSAISGMMRPNSQQRPIR